MNYTKAEEIGIQSRIDDSAQFARSPSRIDMDRILQSIRSFTTISEALRVLGAAVLLASMSLFILQGWNDGNDIRRYLMLLAQTGLLAVAGFTLSHGLKETKGARIFFGLALVSIPANFTILSALVYSVFQWDGALTTVPGYATWQLGNAASVSATLAGAMVVLLPITMFCFAIMARKSAKTLSLHFFALNLMLLLPVRSSVAAGAIALLGTFYALYVAKMLVGTDRAIKTAEGKFALTTLFIPAGIILFRSMYFYQVDSLLIAMLSLAVFLAARQASNFPDRNPRIALGLQTLSVPAALTFALAITDAFHPAITLALHAPLFAVPYTIMAMDVKRRTESRVLAKVIRISISIFVALSFITGVLAHPNALSAFLCLIAGCALFLAGLSMRDRLAAIAGAIASFMSVVFGFESMLALIVNSSWIELAVFGTCAIGVGSVLDRHGVAIKLNIAKRFGANREHTQAIALDD